MHVVLAVKRARGHGAKAAQRSWPPPCFPPPPLVCAFPKAPAKVVDVTDARDILIDDEYHCLQSLSDDHASILHMQAGSV